MASSRFRAAWRAAARVLLVSLAPLAMAGLAGAPIRAAAVTTALADQPLFSDISVPGNLALALSVEFPTAISRAHSGTTYTATSTYLGYFDANKCYLYKYDPTPANSYWFPAGATTDRNCGSLVISQINDQSASSVTYGNFGKWSGNYLNWASMQVIDPFRQALTGGYRVTDSTTTTIIEKAWASNQGSEGSNFARKSIDATTASKATPFPLGLSTRIWALGNVMRIAASTSALDNSGVPYTGPGNVAANGIYEFQMRVKVCDSNVATAGPLESNCVAYGSNYKPEGLMQNYSKRIRYSAFGYLNDGNLLRDGAVMRARQKFIGPTKSVPGQPDASNATAKEWDETTGIFIVNPDPGDATTTNSTYGVTVTNSGVMNYLNKFGASAHTYKTYDPVSELYYAAVRYFKNLGNVTAWTPGSTSASRVAWIDGFPAIPTWDDPILYACQKNFILGIGDTNSHADKNVSGDGTPTGNEPTKPPEVVADTSTQSVTATTYVGNFQGLSNLGTTNPWTGGNNNNSALMAGLAYHTHTTDIRPDDASQPNTIGKQTITTYWLDVLESGFGVNNQFYLAAKYGGFSVPTNYDYNTTANAFWLNNAQKPLWSTSGDVIGGQPRPDNYYTADRPDLMVAGLTKAFASIASALTAYNSAFASPSAQLATSGNSNYSSNFNAGNWTGDVIASSLGFDGTTGAATETQAWAFSTVLGLQAAGTGWDASRRIVTWNPDIADGVPFRYTSISSSQKSALNTTYRTGDDSQLYLNYLRGDQSQETVTTEPYRVRATQVGDIVGSRPVAVGPPSQIYSDSSNPGYAAFRSTWSARKTMVYVGSNDGFLHAIDGSLTGTTAGQEVFAYMPSGVISGPNNTPSVDGIASRGNPAFVHKYFVNARQTVADIDFGRTVGGSGTDWHSVLIGGLGKGGRSYYAIDVTDPSTMNSETAVANKILWEFTDPDMGYSFGDPMVVKTAKYGWVIILTSGYNNSTGQGFFFIVNPRTGTLIAKVSTGTVASGVQAGMAYGVAFIVDGTNGTADAAYAGDLLGRMFRLDLTSTAAALPTPLQLGQATDGTNPQPITTNPEVEPQPVTNTRYVFFGTGRMLDSTDIGSTQLQTYYAIVDGSGAKFATALPTGLTYPVNRSELQALSDPTVGTVWNPLTQDGWYFDLGTGTGGLGYRVQVDSDSNYGIITFASSLPNGDACNPGGTSRIYSFNFATGLTNLLVTNLPVSYVSTNSVVTSIQYVSINGTTKAIITDDAGNKTPLTQKPVPGPGVRRLNWRELPVIN